MKNKEALVETAEKIVIDYANLSGRETAHRAEFRELVLQHLFSLLKEKDREWKEKIKGIVPNKKKTCNCEEDWGYHSKDCTFYPDGWNACRQQVQDKINKLLGGK